MRLGQIERRTHDYERHGTTTLFAALIATVTAETDVKAGSVIGTFALLAEKQIKRGDSHVG